MTDSKALVRPTWDDIAERLRLHEPHPLLLSADPYVLLLVEPSRRAIGLLTRGWEQPQATPVSLARGIRVQRSGPEGEAAVWVDDPELLEVGWHFLAAVAERIAKGSSPRESLEAELERWRDLVSRLAATSVSAAIGALGELAVLRSALRLGHPWECWVGAAGGAIDFRFSQEECEVKATLGNRHEHIINGSEQLKPSVGLDLFLLSLMLAPAEPGSGTSIATILRDLASMGVPTARLEATLHERRGVGVNDPATQVAYVLRDRPMIVLVDASLPVLDASTLAIAFGPAYSRIRDLTYRLDLEGLPQADPAAVSAIVEGLIL